MMFISFSFFRKDLYSAFRFQIIYQSEEIEIISRYKIETMNIWAHSEAKLHFSSLSALSGIEYIPYF